MNSHFWKHNLEKHIHSDSWWQKQGNKIYIKNKFWLYRWDCICAGRFETHSNALSFSLPNKIWNWELLSSGPSVLSILRNFLSLCCFLVIPADWHTYLTSEKRQNKSKDILNNNWENYSLNYLIFNWSPKICRAPCQEVKYIKKCKDHMPWAQYLTHYYLLMEWMVSV